MLYQSLSLHFPFSLHIFSLPWNSRLGVHGHQVGHLLSHPIAVNHQPGFSPATNMDLVTTPSGHFLHLALAEQANKG